MKQDWIDFLTQQGACADGLSFGNQPEELHAAQSAAVIAPLTDLGLIRVSGDDATTFLHNILTNDIKGLAKDGVQRNGFCNAKGRLLATMLIWRDGSDLLIAIPADLHGPILKKLSMYVLRSKVKLADASDERVLIGLSGTQVDTSLAQFAPTIPRVLQSAVLEFGQLIRLDEQRLLLAVDSATAPVIWERLLGSARPVGFATWHWLEIMAGIPAISGSTFEEFVPQMVNFDLIDGISFNKGCYPGQEIVARMKYLGKLKRRMYRARIDNASLCIKPGDHLYAPETGDQSCGQVVNAAPSPHGGDELLAVIQSTCADAGEVHLGSLSGPRLTLLSLPYSYDNQTDTATSSQVTVTI